MSTRSEISGIGNGPPLVAPPLVAGARLSRADFEQRYEATPHLKKAELIDGVVYVPPPVSMDHGDGHFKMGTWLGVYVASTPGTQGGDNATVRLEGDNEPQPDALLRIDSTCGGQSRIGREGYVEGPPELVVEVAATSASYDLHAKLNVYLRSGVREYIVWRIADRELDWFILRGEKYERLAADSDGVYRSETFPGLWLQGSAVLRGDAAQMLATLQQGLTSPEHAGFVAKLRQEAHPQT